VPELGRRTFVGGVAACAAAVAAFLLVQLTAWPPHEDETLALFVSRGSIEGTLDTVLGQRGGAPLHFMIAWLVTHAGGGLTDLRIVSAILAVASVPVCALLAARLAGRTVALAATVLVSGSWILLFHGVYARMYSLFLLTSALSYLAFMRALERGRARDWALWMAAIVLTLATHPYGLLVLASQGAYVVLQRERIRQAAVTFGLVLLAGIPFWRTDLVLASRFDVGVGSGGGPLGAPWRVLEYLWQVAGDFSAGWWFVLALVLVLATLGARALWDTDRSAVVLSACVFAVPAAALTLARMGNSATPESRHLIFALPFFSMLVAAGVIASTRLQPRVGPAFAVLVLALLVGSEVGWARQRTPSLFEGQPGAAVTARRQAAGWLARTESPNDLLFGYDPVYLRAWERTRGGPSTVIPRADPKLAVRVLRSAAKPLGRGVWVFDASSLRNHDQRLTIANRRPWPSRDFETRAFGPYLVIRTREPVRTPRRYLTLASQVMILGKDLQIGDADLNFVTVRRALARL
jgi:4-amino-4-deoxy-L-arabinose transferase-like glycosyltransferase